jgi:hypothetical protein
MPQVEKEKAHLCPRDQPHKTYDSHLFRRPPHMHPAAASLSGKLSWRPCQLATPRTTTWRCGLQQVLLTQQRHRGQPPWPLLRCSGTTVCAADQSLHRKPRTSTAPGWGPP